FDVNYGPVSSTDGLVGFTAGHGAIPRDPVDIDVDLVNGWLPGYDNRPLALAATPGLRPRLGSTFSFELREVPPTAMAAAIFFGFARLEPAVDLTPVGMPGCELSIARIVATKPLAISGDVVTASLSIPANPALSGLTAICQAVVAGMPNVVPSTLGSSNALELTIGSN
ncbi:MAG: hypothetical protein KDB80_05055, partial [Planctomycetes bacterium]|nr:hypothetical protein [Planctomycetota bacterium]